MTTLEHPPIELINKDLKAAAKLMSRGEVRHVIDFYYSSQEQRKRTANRIRSIGEEPAEFLQWVFNSMRTIENRIKTIMEVWTDEYTVGQGSKAQVGIGPVLSAGLLAHIDIAKAPTASQIWRFAGLDPSVTWDKGKKRPWNASLKTLCWKIGESFVKVSGNPKAFYGQLWAQRKRQEEERNEAGEFVDQAKAKLERFKIGKTTEAYKHYNSGHLPPAHVHARSKRWVVKLFLAHWHEVAFEDEYGRMPPEPYVIAQLGHAKKIERP